MPIQNPSAADRVLAPHNGEAQEPYIPPGMCACCLRTREYVENKLAEFKEQLHKINTRGDTE